MNRECVDVFPLRMGTHLSIAMLVYQSVKLQQNESIARTPENYGCMPAGAPFGFNKTWVGW